MDSSALFDLVTQRQQIRQRYSTSRKGIQRGQLHSSQPTIRNDLGEGTSHQRGRPRPPLSSSQPIVTTTTTTTTTRRQRGRPPGRGKTTLPRTASRATGGKRIQPNLSPIPPSLLSRLPEDVNDEFLSDSD